MKPVLIVEGKRYEDVTVQWKDGKVARVSVFNESGILVNYYGMNEKNYTEHALRIDLEKCLFDEDKLGLVEKINSEIEKLLVKKSEELTELSLEHTHACLKYPFKDDVTKHKFELALSHQMGLMNAQEIVTEYMYDDVDLSGGEQDVEQNQSF